eukprot:540159_1
MLLKYESISKTLYNVLIDDHEHKYISSGVHAILDVNYQKTSNKLDKSNVNKIIYLFYWPLPSSFQLKDNDIEVAKQLKKMKRDPSCLLSRVLHEISITVCIPVHAQELKDFGPMKRNTKRWQRKFHIQTSESKLHQGKQQQKTKERTITKLDYLEYSVQKFGSRAAIFHPPKGKLHLNTTYILQDECKNSSELCNSVARKIKHSLFQSEKKDFQYLTWSCNVIKAENLNRESILKLIKEATICADEFIKNLITQIPIQIAHGFENKFKLMYNGDDDQRKYRKKNKMSKIDLCRAIRFGAYDGLIHSWPGEIKVVTSMGKQSTCKSYKLNHLFGTKFDISS